MAWQYLPLVLVTWHDAHGDADGWADLTELDDDPCVVHSIGFQLENAKPNHVTIVQSVITTEVDSALHIPAGMVVSIRTLEVENAPYEGSPSTHRHLSEAGKSERVRGTGSARSAHPAARGRSLTKGD